MNLESLSSIGLLFAFILYTASFFVYVIAIVGSRWSKRAAVQHRTRWGWIGFWLNASGLLAHLVYFFARWAHGGHIPTSNMYEFLTFFSLTISLAFTVFYLIFRQPLLGMFSTPLTLIMIAYAAVFPKDVQPLIPGLQSKWLMIHVTTAALGEAFLAIGFVAGVMFLLRHIDYTRTDKSARRQQRGLEFTLFFVLTIVMFVTSVFAFNAAGYDAQFVRQTVTITGGENVVTEEKIDYVLPPLVQPNRAELVSMDSFLGISKPLFTAPEWMKGVNAARKLNTVIWSILSGILGYYVLRLLLRKPLGAPCLGASWATSMKPTWTKSVTAPSPSAFRFSRSAPSFLR